jgi:hypothetical protein
MEPYRPKLTANKSGTTTDVPLVVFWRLLDGEWLTGGKEVEGAAKDLLAASTRRQTGFIICMSSYYNWGCEGDWNKLGSVWISKLEVSLATGDLLKMCGEGPINALVDTLGILNRPGQGIKGF